MLFSNSNYIKILNKDFIDSYSFDYYEPIYDNKIIIVRSNEEIPKTDHILISTYKRQNQYCFVYNVPDNFKKDYEYILRGKCHLISKIYYNVLLKFWNETEIFLTIKYNPIREMYRVTE